MKPPVTNWVAIVYKDGKRMATFKLAEGTTTIGRDASNQIPIPNSSASLDLEACVTEDGSKPAIKLAAFLAKHFQESREATTIYGKDIARHQRGVGGYNYLVCPLSSNVPALPPCPFVVVVRDADQQ